MVPLDRLLIETDSPFLAPVPHRGNRNEPANVVRVAEAIAALRGRRARVDRRGGAPQLRAPVQLRNASSASLTPSRRDMV